MMQVSLMVERVGMMIMIDGYGMSV